MGWRQKVIAGGLGLASVSCACLYGVVLYLRAAHIGYWNEYLLASGGAWLPGRCLCWPWLLVWPARGAGARCL